MSKQEARILQNTHRINADDGSYVPVFDCPHSVEKKLKTMSSDQRKGFFRKIGVRNPQRIVLFDVDPNSLEGMIGPVPQSNGLREYKIPNGTSIKPYDSLK